MGNGVIKYIRYISKCVLNLIYSTEEKCILCGKNLEEGKRLCINCIRNIKVCNNVVKLTHEDYIFNCYSSVYYSGNVKELILKLKYKNDFMAGEAFINYMMDTIDIYHIKFDIITYVPSSKEALKERGYNQGEYLAKLVAEKTNKKVVKVLEKSKKTKDQIGLTKNQRWENLKNSFKCIDINKIQGKKILLVDDVLTTGATAFYCSKEMILNGAKDVSILTVAKSTL
ncbi:ComF family protein [Clostridium botulinum]|uniref:Competence protein ComF n=1 Tax=Clostridium botulinum TaxID=1491 RepID=A0A9Q1ZBI2_CLOBO|nr:ComF family protein [Clostridium botulinum]AEB76915.1 competence protein F [Clostridium botulinum BKT015925]KEH98349.1 competence protein ComF [Clostridium botulinum D str. 16868]KEI05090.1 competence protein ComF [Clostridium botulinum C/D str. Sp77]KLU76974.1 competence protein ComF [Clostridium botulinum V891]KOA76220.1 competence protein ComF [Clostridium botulinum]